MLPLVTVAGLNAGGVYVEPGDLIMGDVDGVVVVPSSAIDEAVERVVERTKSERITLKELQAGAKLGDVYAKYGTL